MTWEVNITFDFLHNRLNIDRPMKYRVSQLVRLLLQTKTVSLTTLNSILYQIVTESYNKISFLDQYYDLATREVLLG